MIVKNFFRSHILPHLAWMLLRFLWWSWRYTIVEAPELKRLLKEKSPFLLAHWHGDEIALMPFITRYRLATIASTSKDGELMAGFIHKLGGVTSRGSSTRGGVAALKGLIRLIKNDRHNSSFAVDGPKGPIYKVKPGVFEVSRIANAPIFWAGVSADRYYSFPKAWNKATLPKPFARVFVEWHGPMPALSSEDDPKSLQLSTELEEKLNAAKHQASKQFEVGPS